MESTYCVEACPTKALAYLDGESMKEAAHRKAGRVVETLLQDPASSAIYVKLGYNSGRGGQ
jgi:Fe-S-cluster-containing hydrogenase component 2